MDQPPDNQEGPSLLENSRVEEPASPRKPTTRPLTPKQSPCQPPSPTMELSSPLESIPSSPLFAKHQEPPLVETSELMLEGNHHEAQVPIKVDETVHRRMDQPVSNSVEQFHTPKDEPISTKSALELAPLLDNTLSLQEESKQEPSVVGTKRKRETANSSYEKLAFDPPYSAATDEEKEAWQGFCEIESEPAIFNSMLRKWGVKGVKIQEMFGIDDDSLMMLPQPVHGIIFLFQYMDEDAGSQETECPSHVWFANQVTSNSCATVALMNMINNIPSVKLGIELEVFRKFTMSFSPAIRGEQVANYKVIKSAHNLYARKIEMLNVDCSMEQEYKERKKKVRKSGSANKKRRPKKAEVDDSAFHFVAYMPIAGEIWKLDGLDSQPQSIMALPSQPSESDTSSSWLQSLAPMLQARMMDCQDGGIQFNLLAMVQDPLTDAQESLVRHVRLAKALDISEPVAKLEEFGINLEDVTGDEENDGGLHPKDQERIAECAGDHTKFSAFKDEVRQEGVQLRSGALAEKNIVDAEEETAKDRMNDYGPFIQKWLLLLAENGVLRDLAMSDE